MDQVAITVAHLWNGFAIQLGASSLIVRETATNGYSIVLVCFALLGGGGFFFRFPSGD
jgi:hypothetical protein